MLGNESELRLWGDPGLRTTSVPVTVFDDLTIKQAQNLAGTMLAMKAAGLAGVQVGMMLRMIAVNQGADEPPVVLVNPLLLEASEELSIAAEGCLSIPKVGPVVVKRHESIGLEARDSHGEEVTVEANGILARIIQHEIDHINGILVLDRASNAERRRVMSKHVAINPVKLWPEP